MNLLKTRLKLRYLLFVFVIVIEVLGLLPLIAQVHVAEYDEAIFLDVAHSIQTIGSPVRSIGVSGVYYFEHTPLYAYLISPIIGEADTRVMIARWLTSIFAIGCVCGVFLCGEQLKNTLAGFVAAMLTAANSFFLHYSFFVTMEVPMVFLMLLSFYWLIRSEKTGAKRWCFAAGIALAGAVLTKEIALGLAAAYFVYSAFFSRWPDRLRRLILLVAPAFMALLAWVLWAWSWSPTQTQGALSRWFTSAALGGTDSRTQITASQWSALLGGNLLGWSVVVLCLLGLYFCVKVAQKETRVSLVPILYVVVAVAVSYVIRLKELRHLMAVVPMVALVIGLAVSQIFDDLKVRQARVAQFLVGALVVVAVLDTSPLSFLYPDSTATGWLDPLYKARLFENDRYYGALRSAGNYLAEHTQPGEIVTVVHEATAIAFYANRPYNMLYVQSYDSVLTTLAQARYLVVDDHVFSHLTEQQIQSVIDYISQHFRLEMTVVENGRTTPIYRQINLN